LGLEKIAEGLIGNLGISLVSIFIGESSSVFWIMFIAGLVVLGIGIALKLLHLVRKKGKKNITEDSSKKKK